MIRTTIAFLIMVGFAHADFYNDLVNVHGTFNFTQQASLASFNSSLGTLDSISLHELDGLATQGIVTNPTGLAQSVTASTSALTTITPVGGPLLFTDTLTASQSFNLSPYSTQLYGAFSPSNVSATQTFTSGALFDAFNTPNTNVGFTFVFNATPLVDNPSVIPQIFSTNQTDLFITFNYTPNSNTGLPGPPDGGNVPEPSSIIMCGIGLVGLIVYRKKIK
jgi:hypothetical protein